MSNFLQSQFMNLSTVFGLGLSVWGSVILVRHLFISDKEIEEISEIPIEPSTTNYTSATSRQNLSGAVTDITKINQYKNDFIKRRKSERTNGKRGINLIILGFVLQSIPYVFALLGLSPK